MSQPVVLQYVLTIKRGRDTGSDRFACGKEGIRGDGSTSYYLMLRSFFTLFKLIHLVLGHRIRPDRSAA
jgi:hypothetical protein